MTRKLHALSALAVLLVATNARAQQPTFGAFIEGASGVAIGGGSGYTVFSRARSLLRIGGSVQPADMPGEMFSVAFLADVEPTVAVGVDAQWGHWITKMFLFEAGPTIFLAPQTLFGLTGGLRARIPISPSFAILAGISFNAYFAGSDLPANSVVLSALGVVGIHATF